MNNKNIIIGLIVVIVTMGVVVWLGKEKQTILTLSESNSSSESNSNTATQPDLTSEDQITHGHGLAVDVTDSTKLYIATHHGLLVLINEKDLYRVGKSQDDYMGFSVHPTNPNSFFSSGHPKDGGNVGFQKSDDGGNTWKKISSGLDGPVDFHAMAISPVNPNLVYGWYQGNLQRSEDGGKNWVKFSTPAPFVALTGDSQDENIIYAASPQGLFKSQDKGQTWERLIEGFVAAIAVHPTNSQMLLISSEKIGLAKSTDAGNTWVPTKQTFGGQTPLFIAFNKQSPEIVYLLTNENSVYKSSDTGSSWIKIR